MGVGSSIHLKGDPYNLMKSCNTAVTRTVSQSVTPAELARKLAIGEGEAASGGARNSG